MKFKLKNQTQQAEIEEKFPEFDKHLQKQCQKQMDDETDFVLITFKPSENSRVVIAIPKEEVLVTPEYNPDAWNDFPEVTPPEGILMRVETKTGGRFCATVKDGRWIVDTQIKDPEGGMILAEIDDVKRFRPWE